MAEVQRRDIDLIEQFQGWTKAQSPHDSDKQLRERAIFSAMEVTRGARAVYATLEEKTGISATKWQNLMIRRQHPTVSMIAALSRLKPDWTLWLLLGDYPGEPLRTPSGKVEMVHAPTWFAQNRPTDDAWQEFAKKHGYETANGNKED